MVCVGVGGRLLGGHSRGVAHSLSHPKVRDQRVAPRQHHVLRLDIALDDAVCVRAGEGVYDLPEHPDRSTNRKASRRV